MKRENIGRREVKNSVDMDVSSESDCSKEVADTLMRGDNRVPKTEGESLNITSYKICGMFDNASQKMDSRKNKATLKKLSPCNSLPTSQALKDKAFSRPIRLMLDPLTSRKLNFCTMRVSWRPSGSQLEETWEEITNLHDKADSVVASNHQVSCYISSLNGTYTRPTTGHTIKSRPDVYPMISYLIAHAEEHFDVESLQDQLMRTLSNCHAAPIRRIPTIQHKSQLEPAIRLICKDHKNSFINTMVSQSLEKCDDRAASMWKVTHLDVVDGSLANDMNSAEQAFESLSISTQYHSNRLPANCQLVADTVSPLNTSKNGNDTESVNEDNMETTLPPYEVFLTRSSLPHELNASHSEQDIKDVKVDDQWETVLPPPDVNLTLTSPSCDQSPVTDTPILDDVNTLDATATIPDPDISPIGWNSSTKAEMHPWSGSPEKVCTPSKPAMNPQTTFPNPSH